MKHYNLVYSTDYEKDGVTKKLWHKVGKLFLYENEKISIKLDSLPVGNEWNGSLIAFEQKKEDREDQPPF